MNALSRRVNTYFATLLITVIGSGAAMLIVHIAKTGDTFIAQTEVGQVKSYFNSNTK